MLTPTKPVKSCECSSPCGNCCCCTKESIGLGNVDNTADLNKPLSGDMINALSGKVGLDIFTQLKNRVLALENSIPDISDLENRMTNAESNIEMIDNEYKRLNQILGSVSATVNILSTRVTGVNDDLVTVGTRVDALEAKDSNNVKLSGINVQTIQGTLKANDPTKGATDKTLVTANWISQTGANRPNNIIHEYGEEYVYGPKIFKRPSYDGVRIQNDTHSINSIPTEDREYNTINFYDIDGNFMGKLSITQLANSKACQFDIWIRNNDGTFGKITLGSGSK